jgi:hypothetical protein
MTVVLYTNARNKTLDNETVQKVFGESLDGVRQPYEMMPSLMTVRVILVRYLFMANFIFVESVTSQLFFALAIVLLSVLYLNMVKPYE